jgi:hypothetical protein
MPARKIAGKNGSGRRKDLHYCDQGQPLSASHHEDPNLKPVTATAPSYPISLPPGLLRDLAKLRDL